VSLFLIAVAFAFVTRSILIIEYHWRQYLHGGW